MMIDVIVTEQRIEPHNSQKQALPLFWVQEFLLRKLIFAIQL